MEGESLQKPASVPKFASFRPKAASPPQGEGESKNPIGQTVSKSVAKSVHDEIVPFPNGTRSSHSRLHSRLHRHRSRAQLKPTEASEADSGKSSDTFFVDTAGDHENLTYGSAYTRAVPSYSRAGAGGIIGLSRQTKIDRLASSDKSVVLSNLLSDLPRKRERLAFKKIERRGLRTLRIKPNDNGGDEKIDPTADFVAILSSRKRRSNRKDGGADSDTSTSSDSNGTRPYRSAKEMAKKVDRLVDDDLAECTESTASDHEGGRSQIVIDEVQQRRKELSMKVEANPTNPGVWLDLINYQDTILGIDHVSTRSKITKAERQSIADVKISIYEKAIEKVASSKDRENLSLGMMEEGQKAWESKRLSSKWQDLLQRQPTSIALWKRYLDFKQSDFLSFKYEEARAVYLDCLKVLRRTRKSAGISVADWDTIYEIELYVVLRLTVFMREAGFSEHAVASWQAILEYTFFKPEELQHQQQYQLGGPLESTTMSAFEEFWESELPRIGEENAQGWSAYTSRKGRPPEQRSYMEETLTDCERIFDLWVQSERRRSLQSRIPARTIDDVEENDPYRVILFSDIQDILVDPPGYPSQVLLVAAFLTFCHLPPYSTEVVDGHPKTWWRDSFFRNEYLYQRQTLLDNWKSRFRTRETEISKLTNAQQDSALHDLDLENSFRFFASNYQLSHGSLIAARGSWFAAFDSWEDECFEDQGPVQVAWVRRIIKTLVHHGAGGENLAEYYLALELRLSPATVRKTAKTLIKSRSSSVRLYNLYALIEHHLGNFQSAQNVFVTTINMANTLDEQEQRDCLFLWASWMWTLLNAGQTALALERLLMFSHQTLDGNISKSPESLSQASPMPDSTLLLRTQKSLISARDHAISLAFPYHAAIAAECLILLSYLANRLSLLAAHSTFISNLNHFSARFAPSSSILEHIHQSFARLLYYHATRSSNFTPSIIRSCLAESIAQFPQNTIFLSLYAWIEARFRIDDRVRSIMKDVVLSSTRPRNDQDQGSIIGHFFAVHTEINRGVALGSNTHAVRGTFERAVNSSGGGHSAGLWKLYFLFELSRHELEKAKGVFYRAIRACPWAKELYMMAFEHLAPVMGATELRGLYELMGEKELRIHVGLEDIFDRRNEK